MQRKDCRSVWKRIHLNNKIQLSNDEKFTIKTLKWSKIWCGIREIYKNYNTIFYYIITMFIYPSIGQNNFKYGLIVKKTCTKNMSSVRREIIRLYASLNKSKNSNKFVYTTQLEYSKIKSDEKKLVVMIRYWYKTDPQMIYQQDPIVRMFVSYKLHKNARTNLL